MQCFVFLISSKSLLLSINEKLWKAKSKVRLEKWQYCIKVPLEKCGNYLEVPLEKCNFAA